MFTFDKMQNISTLMCKNSKSLNSVCILLWPSDRVVDCIQIAYLGPLTTGTMPLTTRNQHTAIKQCELCKQ